MEAKHNLSIKSLEKNPLFNQRYYVVWSGKSGATAKNEQWSMYTCYETFEAAKAKATELANSDLKVVIQQVEKKFLITNKY